MTEQPLPRRGKRLVLPHAIWLLAGALVRQTRKGWQRYHSLLRTENGRDVGRDWLEELVDLLMYGTQLVLENRDLKAEVAKLKKLLAEREL
jgi:hypothetical protein